MDVGWLEKAELKPTQPSLAGAWLSLAKVCIKAAAVKLGHIHFLHHQDGRRGGRQDMIFDDKGERPKII